MNIEDWFSDNFESKLRGRYLNLDHLRPLYKTYESQFQISQVGISELGEEISLVKIGSGPFKIFAWSQMHGNETTSTKALFDLFKFLSKTDDLNPQIRRFYKKFTLYVIPMLNPDGARSYMRNNANDVDLNRDAQNLSQTESLALFKTFKMIQPDLCLNLHGQRSIFGLATGKPAMVSFLSPSSDSKRTVTPSRKKGMKMIARINNYLENHIRGQIGRYDDTFNEHCFGDFFQMNEVPVILVEAGHASNDYLREQTRKYLFYSFSVLLGLNSPKVNLLSYKDYFKIPENKKNYYDYILRNVFINDLEKETSLAIQFKETLVKGAIKFVPILTAVGDLNDKFGHKEIDGSFAKVLVNSQQNIEIGSVISVISNKKQKSLKYFDKNCFEF